MFIEMESYENIKGTVNLDRILAISKLVFTGYTYMANDYENMKAYKGSCTFCTRDNLKKISITKEDYDSLIEEFMNDKKDFKMITKKFEEYIDLSLLQIEEGKIEAVKYYHDFNIIVRQDFDKIYPIKLSKDEKKIYYEKMKEIEWREKNNISLNHSLTETESMQRKLQIGV